MTMICMNSQFWCENDEAIGYLGTSQIAEMAHYYFSQLESYAVEGLLVINVL